MYDTLYNKLLEDEYPVCLLKDFTKFNNHSYRILLIKDIEIPELYKTNISDDTFSLTERLKQASKELEKEKENIAEEKKQNTK